MVGRLTKFFAPTLSIRDLPAFARHSGLRAGGREVAVSGTPRGGANLPYKRGGTVGVPAGKEHAWAGKVGAWAGKVGAPAGKVGAWAGRVETLFRNSRFRIPVHPQNNAHSPTLKNSAALSPAWRQPVSFRPEPVSFQHRCSSAVNKAVKQSRMIEKIAEICCPIASPIFCPSTYVNLLQFLRRRAQVAGRRSGKRKRKKDFHAKPPRSKGAKGRKSFFSKTRK